MQIANPIYDVVFKYLMEDTEIAKLIIGTIISEEIVELDFLPQESTLYMDRVGNRSLTVYRLDFSAKIKLPDKSYKQVLIEIQKAKLATDIMRFRRYLGEQYQDDANTYLVTIDEENGITEQKALPIVTIYFLGHSLEKTTTPVIKVARQYYDVTTGEEIETSEEFIESLTHDSYVIQIPHLHPDHKSEVEQLLMIFDQRWITTADKRIMNFNEADYPERYREITRRLQSAIATSEVRRIMKTEDDILKELTSREQVIAKQSKALVEKDKALVEKDKALVEKDKALSEKDRMIEELQKRIQSLE